VRKNALSIYEEMLESEGWAKKFTFTVEAGLHPPYIGLAGVVLAAWLVVSRYTNNDCIPLEGYEGYSTCHSSGYKWLRRLSPFTQEFCCFTTCKPYVYIAHAWIFTPITHSRLAFYSLP
jgi:hypothetical protein